jgi:heat shock protein HtpX
MSGPWDSDPGDKPPRPRVLVPSPAAVDGGNGPPSASPPAQPPPSAGPSTGPSGNDAAGPWAAPAATAAAAVNAGIVHTDFTTAQRANRRATIVLLVLLTVVAGLFGYLIGWTVQALDTPDGRSVFFLSSFGILAGVALVAMSTVWSGISLAFGDKMILHVADAIEVTPQQEPVLHNVVEEMAIAAGLPKPRVFVMEVEAENAFATGMSPRHAAIAVTRGLLQKLNREELQGVVGHEMGHIANADTRYMAVVGVTVGLIALVSQLILRSLRFVGTGSRNNRKGGGAGAIILLVLLIVAAILAPIAAKLVQLAVSRQREYLADATSVQFTRNPAGLISALAKLDAAAAPFHGATQATQHLFIVNPMRSFGEKASALWATHPATQQRIDRLRHLGQ